MVIMSTFRNVQNFLLVLFICTLYKSFFYSQGAGRTCPRERKSIITEGVGKYVHHTLCPPCTRVHAENKLAPRVGYSLSRCHSIMHGARCEVHFRGTPGLYTRDETRRGGERNNETIFGRRIKTSIIFNNTLARFFRQYFLNI